METIIGILALCAVMVGGAAWLLTQRTRGRMKNRWNT